MVEAISALVEGDRMNTARTVGSLFLMTLLAANSPAADAKPTAKEALKPFNELVGSWRGTGEPEGTRAEKLKNFWSEKIAWDWQFKGDDVWMRIAFEKGKYFKSGELRYLPDLKEFKLTVATADDRPLTFNGKLDGKVLTLDRVDPEKKETQRLVFTFLHSNRHLYRYEVKANEGVGFKRLYQVGATKEGVPFAGPADSYPECIVSGGRGTMAVTHNGKTYYVCCSGCRDEFKEKPDKYVKEYEAKKK
jgi:YHS domain-containing protein